MFRNGFGDATILLVSILIIEIILIINCLISDIVNVGHKQTSVTVIKKGRNKVNSPKINVYA